MAYTGTPTYVRCENGVHYEATGFNADAETVTINVLDKFGFIPTKHSIVVKRTAGSTDVIDVDLDLSDDNTAWETIATLASSSTPVQTSVVDKMGKYIRIIVNTVGAGNTLTLTGTFLK